MFHLTSGPLRCTVSRNSRMCSGRTDQFIGLRCAQHPAVELPSLATSTESLSLHQHSINKALLFSKDLHAQGEPTWSIQLLCDCSLGSTDLLQQVEILKPWITRQTHHGGVSQHCSQMATAATLNLKLHGRIHACI